MEFTPPGKGGWMSLRDHFPRALTPELAQLIPPAIRAGEAVPMERYGLPIRSLMASLVHGHLYVTAEPLVGPPSDATPPAPVLWVLTRVVPAFRRRNQAARRALAERPWRAEADHWFASEREEWIAAARRFQAVDPAGLDDDALADHLRALRDHLASGFCRHFELHGPDLVPTGLLLARCADWGVAPDVVLPVLAGASPSSTGQCGPLDALRAAVRRADAPPQDIEELRAIAPEELQSFFDDRGWRLITGYDLDDLALIELPELILTLATAPDAPRADADTAAALDRLRAAVAPAEHEELERLVEDARATIGVRDDNGPLTGAWPTGLLRRGLLETARRLLDRGALLERDHVFELLVDEAAALLAHGTGPTADAVGARAADRAHRSSLVAPPTLGSLPDIPVAPMPAPMRLIARAQLAIRDTFTTSAGVGALDGEGVGRGIYRGRACVATDPADALERLEAGDVLVTTGTTPAYNMALSIAGAVVVEEGGLMSHAAVIARELDLPAVIGAVGAMHDIPDGALVEVDPGQGRVRVLTGA